MKSVKQDISPTAPTRQSAKHVIPESTNRATAKQVAFHAHQVNFKAFPVRPSVNFVHYQPTLVAKPETGRALIVRLGGHQKKVAPSANLAMLELSAVSKVNHVSRARKVSIVQVKRKMRMVILRKKVQILRNVLTVRQDGRPRREALSVKPAELERTVMAVNYAH